MRLFVAINFGEAMMDALTETQDRLRGHGVEGNFTRPENLHLTLAFIKDYGNPQDILDAMEAVPFEQFLIRLDGIRHYRQSDQAVPSQERGLGGLHIGHRREQDLCGGRYRRN